MTATRVGLGFDVHPFAPDGRLVLGGVILDGPALAGHSDGDAVSHAVADALLGAAGLGDIGTLFPASDPQHEGADSLGFVRAVAAMLAERGWAVVNVDIVVAAEQPRLAAHVGAMCHNVAEALAVARVEHDAAVAVSVKPKRGEGLGAIGRAEGIAVWAVALLQR